MQFLAIPYTIRSSVDHHKTVLGHAPIRTCQRCDMSLIRGSAAHFDTVSSTFVVLHGVCTSSRPTCCPTVSTSKVVRPGLLDATDTPRHHSPSPSPCPAIRWYRPLLLHLAIAGRVPSIRCTWGKHRLDQPSPPPRARLMVGCGRGQQVSSSSWVGLRDCIRGTGRWRVISRQKTPRAVATSDLIAVGSHDALT
jgi:hypothetical protein